MRHSIATQIAREAAAASRTKPRPLLSDAMIEALKFMKGNNGTDIGPGCPATAATMTALSKRGLVRYAGRHYELTDAGAGALANL